MASARTGTAGLGFARAGGLLTLTGALGAVGGTPHAGWLLLAGIALLALGGLMISIGTRRPKR